MGIFYHYANFTKRERFAVCALGGGSKIQVLGRTLAARAFHLLTVDRTRPDRDGYVSMGRGHWARDSIAIVGDDLMPDFEHFQADFIDIAADVILIIFDEDGFEAIGEAATQDDMLFMQLCYLVATRQGLRLEVPMRAKFGGDYLKRYKELCRQNVWFSPKDLAASAGG